MKRIALTINEGVENFERRKEKMREMAEKKRTMSKGSERARAEMQNTVADNLAETERGVESEPLVERRKRKKSRRDDGPLANSDDVFADEVVKISYPAEGSFYSDPYGLLEEARKNLLPEDDKRLTSLGHRKAAEDCFLHNIKAMQGTIFMEREISALSKKCKELLALNSILKKENTLRKKETEEASREKARLDVEMKALETRFLDTEKGILEKDERVKSLEGEVDSLKTLVADLEDAKENSELEASTATEFRLMKEFLDHRGEGWKPEKVLADYEELQRMAKELEASDGDNVEETARESE